MTTSVSKPAPLNDSFGRRFSYLRLSITDACNFKCQYCLPNGFKPNGPANFLSVQEITSLVRTFARLGTRKVRITGGEPSLRSDLTEIIASVRATSGIETVALSTNGFSLKQYAREWREAGLDQINISIDSLDHGRFASRTGRDQLGVILEGVSLALDLGLRVKFNAVLMKSNFAEDLKLFKAYVESNPVSVRFIELMPTLENSKFFEDEHLRGSVVKSCLMLEGWESLERGLDDGPAFEFTRPGYAGRLGLIAPYAPSFCDNCNRLRVTSRGGLRLCLFGSEDFPVRDYLRPDVSTESFEAHLRAVLLSKKVSHFLSEGRLGNNRSFSVMGG